MLRLNAFVLAAVLMCTAAQADPAPWQSDGVLARTTMSDVQSGGILSVKAHVDDLEHALAGAKASIALAGSGTPTRYVLTDGAAQTLAGMLMPKPDKAVGQTVAVPNPYPQIGLLLGSYYNEVGRPEDAIRVLDLAIDSDTIVDIAGEMSPVLKGERANSLMTLKRWPEALAAYADALAIAQMAPALRAHLLRGRGYADTELGHLDDAEKDYKASLDLAPGNALALHELDYIRQLRAGAAPVAPGGLKPLQPPAQQPSSPAPTDNHI